VSVSWKCPECGLDYDTILPHDAVVAVRSFPRRYAELLPPRDDDEKPDGVIRRRPEPKVWSALEYTAHVVDVFDELAGDVKKITTQDHPTITGGMDPDQLAIDAKYNEQDRSAVLDRLKVAAENMAKTIENVPNDAWSKTGTYSFGDREALDMARNAVHEGYHHLRDTQSVLARVIGAPVPLEEDDDG
jgi:hypothetical protein